MLHVLSSLVEGLMTTVLIYAGVFLLICVALCVGFSGVKIVTGHMLPYVVDVLVVGGIFAALVSLW